jgi:hypothetical protein
VRHQLDAAQVGDPRRRFAGELGRTPAETLSCLNGQQVGAQPVDLREQPGLRGGGQPEDPRATPVYRFSCLIVSTMLSLRIIAPETIMVTKTIARMPAMQARIAPQGRVNAKVLTPSNW